MPANDAPRGLVPDDRLDIAKLLNGALQLVVLRIAGLQVFTGIVVRRDKLLSF